MKNVTVRWFEEEHYLSTIRVPDDFDPVESDLLEFLHDHDLDNERNFDASVGCCEVSTTPLFSPAPDDAEPCATWGESPEEPEPADSPQPSIPRSQVQPMQSTPGPWSVAEYNGSGPRDIHSDPQLDQVVASTVGLTDDLEDAANAILLAASPELREALADLVEYCAGADCNDQQFRDAEALLDRLRDAGA